TKIRTTIDLEAMGVKVGESVRYYLEVRDRKGQSARTAELAIRVATADPAAADKQLANFDKSQDPFREKLVKMIAEQQKIRDKVENSRSKYTELSKKVELAKAEAQAKAAKTTQPAPKGSLPNTPNTTPPPPSKPGDPPPEIKLDPEAAKMLEELNKELAE